MMVKSMDVLKRHCMETRTAMAEDAGAGRRQRSIDRSRQETSQDEKWYRAWPIRVT